MGCQYQGSRINLKGQTVYYCKNPVGPHGDLTEECDIAQFNLCAKKGAEP